MSLRFLALVMIVNLWLGELAFLAGRLEQTIDQPLWVNLCRVGAAFITASITSAFVWRGSRS